MCPLEYLVYDWISSIKVTIAKVTLVHRVSGELNVNPNMQLKSHVDLLCRTSMMSYALNFTLIY